MNRKITITNQELYKKTFHRHTFSIKVSDKVYRPVYLSIPKSLTLGMIIVFIGVSVGQVDIGIIVKENPEDDTLDVVQVLKTKDYAGNIHGSRKMRIHVDSVHCYLKEVVVSTEKVNLYRLWLEFPYKNGIRETTIKIDDNIKALLRMRKTLQDQVDKTSIDGHRYRIARV